MPDISEHLHGSLDLLVLKTLTWGPMHGYAIVEWLEKRTDGDLTLVDVALYKALHRLEAAGALESEWGLSDNNRRAKYYSITPKGRRMLTAEITGWQRYVSAMGRVIEAT